jgi:glycosyltransferase involved in cell wall biosynthesis
LTNPTKYKHKSLFVLHLINSSGDTSNTTPVNVLVVCPYSHVGGAQIHTKNLFSFQTFFKAKFLCIRGDAYKLFKQSQIGDVVQSRLMKKYFRPKGGWEVWTILCIMTSTFLAVVEVVKQILEFHPKIIYANGTFDALFCLLPCTLFRVPLVVTQQLIYRDRIDLWAMYCVSLVATKMVAISEAVLDNMRNVLPYRVYKKKCVKIFNATRIPELVECNNSNNSLVRIGMVSGLLRWKGIYEFIEAIGLLKQKYPNCYASSTFFIIGESTKADQDSLKYFQDLQTTKEKLYLAEKVNFLGRISEIESLYSTIDCCINFSLDPEPFGLTVVEAMARKKIVLVAAHGGPAEIVSDGIDGFHVKPNSIDDLVDKMAMVIHKFKSKEFELIRNRARQAAVEKFNLISQQERYNELFRCIL